MPHLEYTCPRLGARRRPPAPGQSSSSSSSGAGRRGLLAQSRAPHVPHASGQPHSWPGESPCVGGKGEVKIPLEPHTGRAKPCHFEAEKSEFGIKAFLFTRFAMYLTQRPTPLLSDSDHPSARPRTCRTNLSQATSILPARTIPRPPAASMAASARPSPRPGFCLATSASCGTSPCRRLSRHARRLPGRAAREPPRWMERLHDQGGRQGRARRVQGQL